MFKQNHDDAKEKGSRILIKDAEFPKPFAIGLEFNAPVHGTWNIVHTGMLVPESHQIYACAVNCNRGVLMTAAEMDEMDRFSTITITQKDILYGNMEQLLLDGTSDIIEKLEHRPRMLMLFPSCIHHFLGTDMEYIYRKLEEKFPDICFARCFMDPTMQKHSLPPDVRLRREMYSGLQNMKKNKKSVAFIGNNLRMDEKSEMKQMLRKAEITYHELQTCRTYEDYLRHAESILNIVTHPNAIEAAKKLKKRLHTEYLYIPFSYSYEEIEKNLRKLADSLAIKLEIDFEIYRDKAEKALEEACQRIGRRPIAIDFTFTSRPLGLAKLLIEHGFQVKRVYLDVINKEEKEEFQWLQENSPYLTLISTMHHRMRIKEENVEQGYLALGQKAAYFTNTEYFVNTIEENGYYGLEGIMHLAQDMIQASLETKDARRILPEKGLGCTCVLENKNESKLDNSLYTDQLEKIESRKAGKTKIRMPIYTGDVSAAAAALYELGGMVVMHDASGCNSTYNSHDELRWYDKESCIYISGLTHIDAIMGNDEKFICEITEAAIDLRPKFIAIASTPIPYIMGTDFKAITTEIENRTGIPCFFVPTNGTHSYIYGAGNAFLAYAKKILYNKNYIPREKKHEKIMVNILGVTPLDFAKIPWKNRMEKWLAENGMQLGSCFAMGSSMEEIQKTMEADVNLVVSASGYFMAQYLEKKAEIPYLVGTPVEKFADILCEKLRKIVRTKKSEIAYEENAADRGDICIVGEPIISNSIAFAIKRLYDKNVKVVVPIECPEDLLKNGVCMAGEEQELVKAVKDAKIVIADELLRPLCNTKSTFYPFPHVACSGRIYENEMPDLFNI